MAMNLQQDYPPLELSRREPYVLEQCRGKRVCDLGFSDWPVTEQRIRDGALLHHEIHKVASFHAGVDGDADCRHLFKPDDEHYRLCFGNVEDADTFAPLADADIELVVAGEIMEHLNNPGLFLDAVKTVMGPASTLLITVPNGLWFGHTPYAQAGIEWVHPDHNYWYSPTTIQTLLNKHGYHVDLLRGYHYGSEPAGRMGPSNLGCPGLIVHASLAAEGTAYESLRRWPHEARRHGGQATVTAGVGSTLAVRPDRPRVLCITDTQGWAYDLITDELEQTLGERYEFKRFPADRLGQLGAWGIREMALGCDVVYCFSNVMPPAVYDLLSVRPIVAGIHGDLNLEQYAPQMTPELQSRFAALGVVNDNLRRRCLELGLNDRVVVTHNGADVERFADPERSRRRAGLPIRAGWAGWANHSQGRVKRFYDRVVPGCRLAGVPLLAAERERSPVAPENMPAFYQAVDLLVCNSLGEGASGPVLEAAASGCCILSTRCGVAEQQVEDGRTGWLLDGTLEHLVDRLYWCRTHPTQTRAMGQAMAEHMRAEWTWAKRAEGYAELFEIGLGGEAGVAASEPVRCAA
jgi:glycosyltransferase involved in cell wall biosynthesis